MNLPILRWETDSMGVSFRLRYNNGVYLEYRNFELLNAVSY